MSIEIRPLNKDLRETYLSFFDNMVFDENPDRSKCYCHDYHFLGDVATCTREESRSGVIDLINANKLTGYLALENETAIGWCNANNRSNYQRLLRDYDYVDNREDRVVSIVCFLIHPDYRRQGIAQKILERIIHEYSTKDYDFLEAYPKINDSSSEGNFKGPLELYTRFGFKIHKEYDDHYVVRKQMT